MAQWCGRGATRRGEGATAAPLDRTRRGSEAR
uniref:Uncharacterized protein n=1 Tax=Arundo donax TaxID=35708 RepID=A0A0A9BEK2_ARUDO